MIGYDDIIANFGELIRASLTNLGAETNSDFVEGVTVIWVASPKDGKSSVVGWYKNATVYRELQQVPHPGKTHKSNDVEYYLITAAAKDAYLLPEDERPAIIPRNQKGGFGQSNIWYANKSESQETVKKVKKLIESKEKAWSDDELLAAVRCYVDMHQKESEGKKFNKKKHYSELSSQFGRSEKAFEYRMLNISYVYALLGRRFVSGLKPATNVGSDVARRIQEMIEQVEGQYSGINAGQLVEGKQTRKQAAMRPPKGNRHPETIDRTVTQHVRDIEVVNWVLGQADGNCECCSSPAPFIKIDGTPFLEVHHVQRLADGGTDTIDNAVAICPNCHRELHYGQNRDELIEELRDRIPRLKGDG